MDKIKLIHQENYNGWTVECDSLPERTKEDLQDALADYSFIYYDDDGDYQGGVDFNDLNDIVSQYSSDFKLSLDVDSDST